MKSDIKRAYSECEKIIKKNSLTFYAAFKELKKEDALAVYAIYAFCRVADDYADESFDLEALVQLRAELEAFKVSRECPRPFWLALDDVFSRYQMSYHPFEKMLDGQIQFLNISEISSDTELWEYCYAVAGTVGEMLLPVVCTSNMSDTQETAILLGEAMQLTNILRDLKEDIALNRFYLPNLKEALNNPSEVQQLIKRYAILAEERYQTVRQNIDIFKKEARLPILLSLYYYRGILEKIKKDDFKLPQKRIVVDKIEKAKLYLKAKEELACKN